MDAPTKSQPWKDHWPPDVTEKQSDESSSSGSSSSESSSQQGNMSGKGAQPNNATAADGTKVLRLDKISQFISDFDKGK